jgi:altered-inheritance-of-mitochondria protein 5
MGRIHGFLGGVLLTSTITYYTGEYFRSNQKFISTHLQTSDHIIRSKILSPNQAEPIPTTSHSSTISRVGIVETSKDIWNDEIIKMVNWVYGINWYQWGVKLDRKVMGLTEKVVDAVTEK